MRADEVAPEREAYEIPPRVAFALMTERPSFLDAQLEDEDYTPSRHEVQELLRLIRDLIADRKACERVINECDQHFEDIERLTEGLFRKVARAMSPLGEYVGRSVGCAGRAEIHKEVK